MIDLSGRKFGALLVLEPTEKRYHGHVVFLCRCECGKRLEIPGIQLREGKRKGCGCGAGYKRRGRPKGRDPKRLTKSYKIWTEMKQRCYNRKHPHYHVYGGAGIGVSDVWQSFDEFYRDMGECPKNRFLVRRDKARDFSRTNCRWGKRPQQGRST